MAIDSLTYSSEPSALDRLLLMPRRQLLFAVALLIGALVLLEWTVDIEYSLGVLYVIPMMLGGVVLNRVQTVMLAIFCAFARGLFTQTPTQLDYMLRFTMASLAYTGAGLFILELRRNRQMYIVHLAQLEEQAMLRREAEEQLRVLADSSPAAIMTLDEDGKVLAANRAASELLGMADPPGLVGKRIESYIPLLADALRMDTDGRRFRTAVQCWGKRTDRSAFLAQAWFSTYVANGRKRLAVIAVDTSDEMRDREERHLEQLARNHRVLAGAVSHEIRNLCAAVNVVCSNLERSPSLRSNPDFLSLQTLVQGLSRLASFDLRTQSNTLTPVDLHELLERFRIICGRTWEEAEGSIEIQAPEVLPRVMGDLHELLQVLLNLSQNSARAVADSEERQFRMTVSVEQPYVHVRLCDSGGGIANPERLFHPFESGHESSGLGLYVSRALVRNFGGDLSYEPSQRGACFLLELMTVDGAMPREAA